MKPKKQHSVKKDASVFLLAAIICVIAGGAFAGYFFIYGTALRDSVFGERVVGTLFIIEDAGHPLVSYALFCYPATHRGALFDIPQDTGLILRSLNRVDRIDRIYDPSHPDVYKKEVERLLGINLPYMLVLTMDGLRSLVDLLEGIELNIPETIIDLSLKPPVMLPAGRVTLDGDKAQSFMLYEAPSAEITEIRENRKIFFLALIKKAGEMQKDLNKPLIIKYLNEAFKTSSYMPSFMPVTLSRLFEVFAGVDPSRITSQSIGGNYRNISGERLLVPFYDGSLIKDIVSETVSGLLRSNDSTARGRLFTVEILNGTSTAGLAARTAELLRSFGYDVINVGNADNTQYSKTLIIDRSGEEEYGNGFASIIRCKNIKVEAPANSLESGAVISENNTGYTADFTLILGWDFNGRYTAN